MEKVIKSQSGFTLIELVMVIVLVGILSYGAASLFSSRDGFAGFIAKDQLISSALLAQQVAMGMSATSDPVSLTVGVDSNKFWTFTLTKDNSGSPITLDPVTQDASGGSLVIDGTTMSASTSKTFTWNSLANIKDGLNHEIRFSGLHTYRVCLSSSGYAYESQVVCP